jgi:hypothetical protein
MKRVRSFVLAASVALATVLNTASSETAQNPSASRVARPECMTSTSWLAAGACITAS